MKKTLNLIITGATGIIGRHVLYEYLAQYAGGKLSGCIVALIRNDAVTGETGLQRIQELLADPLRPDFIKQYDAKELLSFIKVIEAGMEEVQVGHFAAIQQNAPYHVIHLAASTNLNPESEEVRNQIEAVNYQGTLQLFHATKKIAAKFVFISTAFSSGTREGVINDDYINRKQLSQFRNHYEEFKLRTEKELAALCKQHHIQWQVLRPSIVCGRLLDAPYYATPKFNVFYALGKFFKVLIEKNIQLPVRIHRNPGTSLNIIPVDYVAKAIVRAVVRDDIEQLNIVHTYNTPVDFIVQEILNAVGYENYSFTALQPVNLNVAEALYYKSAGLQFTPYITQPLHYFDTALLRTLMHDVPEPGIVEEFGAIFGFAKEMNFEYRKVA